ncbi:putative zinc-binding metallopeptidase [Candidatus Nitronereus thalassa]|uniref:Zinc-binding metallopeptidase n=1 Tax=Candidatus Nitronereus thalassa TaxID=3020898 RepID=A0ABU3KAZ2_9BACT|nr:putative zinc-binding metallopeptidase [Candidatus Nitronereus thalassa]MDT7043576.1 putative zinc-binding metallopeptidase [Candidatus Nitronereus thalassa]
MEPQILPWVDWSDEQILDLRFCDLGVKLPGSPIAPFIRQLDHELKQRGLEFRPHCWLSDDWFSPDGVPGIAVPFYMAHPRLQRLELNQMLEVEGGTAEWCLRILRHEAGHAIENAYRLRRLRRRQELFGISSQAYPDWYTPKPYSKKYVVHLDMWYAQSHPDEDFAETFAVWLDPESKWKQRYAGWPAFRKLQYVDDLMQSLVGKTPPVANKHRVDPLSSQKKTLRQHYHEKRERYGLDFPDFYERDLRRLFSDHPDYSQHPRADQYLSKIRKEVRKRVTYWTGEYQYTIDQVLKEMIAYCRKHKLRLVGTEEQTKMDFMVLLTVQTMNYLHGGHHRVAL